MTTQPPERRLVTEATLISDPLVAALAQALLATGLFDGDGTPDPVDVLTPDPNNPGFYLLEDSGLVADTTHPGFYLLGSSGLALDPEHPGFYTIGA